MMNPHSVLLSMCLLGLLSAAPCGAQQMPAPESTVKAKQTSSAEDSELQQIQLLQRQMQVLEQQMAEDQRQLSALRTQLQGLQSTASQQAEELGRRASVQSASGSLEEQQAAASTQIATLDQKKVETESKFPLRLHGTLLLSGFVNSGSVDEPAVPTAALGGPGSTGFSVRQTSLGLSASGPHVFQAESRADVDVDFFGTAASGYENNGGLLRLRTAHAALAWKNAEAYFSLDRPLLSPYRPESLLAAATPELAWSGNLWAWNPQIGIAYHHGTANRFRAEVALIDAADPYGSFNSSAAASTPGAVDAPSLSEASRRPGVQSRLSLEHGAGEEVAAFGVAGYYSPHRFQLNKFGPHYDFTAWAGSLDFRVPLGYHSQLTGTVYRGAGLGGLGGGGYRDYAYRVNAGQLQLIALDDVGGWVGVHQSLGQQLSWNAGYGVDNPFAGQLRAFSGGLTSNPYSNIARNRTVFGNIIYAPRAYLLFSAEYRNLHTAPIVGRLWTSNVAGFGAAYRF